MKRDEYTQRDDSPDGVVGASGDVLEATPPPPCNTGAQNAKRNLGACFDYCRITVPETDVRQVAKSLPDFEFSSCDYGRFGYRKMLVAEGCSVLYDGREDMGVHVDLTGDGCRFMESARDDFEWASFLHGMKERNARFTRMDVAFDDKRGDRTIEQIRRKFQKQHVATTARSFMPFQRVAIGGNTSYGMTIAIGSRASDTYARFYCKQGQLNELFPGIKFDPWLRFEFEFKKERADVIGSLGAVDDWEKIRGACRAYVEIQRTKVRAKDPGRGTIEPWYDELLGQAPKWRMPRGEFECKTAAQKRAWLLRFVSGTVVDVIKAEGGDQAILNDIRDAGLQMRNGGRSSD